jgi:hypothetical protein
MQHIVAKDIFQTLQVLAFGFADDLDKILMDYVDMPYQGCMLAGAYFVEWLIRVFLAGDPVKFNLI